jgi:hypothetical protein
MIQPRQKLHFYMALISAMLFAYTLFFKTEFISLKNWNFTACQISKNWSLHTNDCLFTREKSIVLSYPVNPQRKLLKCFYEQNTPLMTDLNPDTGWVPPESCQVWNKPLKVPDIGWDSYQVWYARALIIFENSKTKGLLHSLTDWNSFRILENKDYLRYPWLVSQVYAFILWLFNSSHPLILQVFQVLLMFACGLLFYKLRPKNDKYLWLCFALAPISARFLFYIYADLWVLGSILFLWWALEHPKQGRWILAPLILASCWLKAEAYVQILFFLCSWMWLNKKLLSKNKSIIFIAFSSLLVGAISYWRWASNFPISENQTSLLERIVDPLTWTQRVPQISRYFLDVYFRPAFWGPLVVYFLYLLWKVKNQKDCLIASVPYFILIVLIPTAFLGFPDGTYREVVLTGANRALWQLLPLMYLLMQAFLKALPQKNYKQ